MSQKVSLSASYAISYFSRIFFCRKYYLLSSSLFCPFPRLTSRAGERAAKMRKDEWSER